ncbi:MAG: DNA recombination protein RmuC [Clostridia bacterium]|nr:DNA recombination protein RmuC [Clostridia bacterium]
MIAIGIVVIVLSVVIITIQLKILSKKDNEEERYYLEQQFSRLSARQDALNSKINDDFRKIAQYLNDSSMQNEQKLENIRKTLSYSIARMSEENTRHLDSIRNTVDEKLQDTLDKKLNESFKIVSERLEQVYKGLGEMQNIASSVGDLKKVLSNVKTRGVLGEVQLGAIIEQILSPEQYERNVATKKGSQANIEYAVKLPGDEYGPVWLPIDAKFPADAYANVVDAYESGDSAIIDLALRQLKDRLRSFAKDISTKYVSPPDTTDFAIMFLPFEGLYSEAVRLGMVEILQNEYKINIAGPTTMAALLNSLQMGFKTLAIQKRSGEVWNVLGAVKNEFDTFATVLESAQRRINQANDDLDKLIGVRTRKIQRTLKDVESTAYEIKSAEEE